MCEYRYSNSANIVHILIPAHLICAPGTILLLIVKIWLL